MTPNDRIATADRAKAALSEFLAPAFAHVEGEWMEMLKRVAKSEDPNAPERIMRVTAGLKAIDVIRSQIEAFVLDGRLAEAELQHSAKIANIGETKRRMGIG